MKNIVKIFIIMLLGANMFAQTNSQDIDKDVVKNVVLINSAPWEVLMSKNGDILAKLTYLPDYLKGYDIDWKNNTNFEPAIPLANNTNHKKQIKALEKRYQNVDLSGLDKIKEIYFSVGSALLSNKAINDLNNIALELNSNKNKVLRLFGFIHEPESRYSILGRRRMDAVIAYLKIKGVDIDNQIIRGNNVKGENNKIVFAFN
jgi:outer membrane protein OmpA-like peptidoglycan-associated protein